MSRPPYSEPSHNPQGASANEEPTQAEVLDAVLFWLRHWHDSPREKSKAADWVLVALTLVIGIAAFWSACIFQSQLTVARQTMESQTRPWVGNGEIEVKQTTFLVYPDNPIQARTQVDFVIDVPIKDVGNSPALDVETGLIGTMTKQTTAPPTMDTMMESACGGADKNAKSVGGVLFPNTPGTTVEWPVNIMVPYIQITEVHRVWIAICITYNGTTSDQKLHHTKVWMASWPINGQPTEIRRTTQPTIVYYSLPITRWGVIRTQAD